jgi:hypothetical protein
MQLDPLFPWEKVAEPQTDFVDLTMLWHTANQLYGYQKTAHGRELSIFDGQVGVNLTSTNSIRQLIQPAEFLENNLAELLEFTLKLTPYVDQVSKFLDVYHPYVKDFEINSDPYTMNLTMLGCSCGPITSPKLGSIEVSSTYPNPISAGDGIIHEVWHQRMHALGIDFETHAGLFFTNQDDELYDSPIRKDKLRPMPAVIQAQYSYIGVTEYYKTLIDQLFDPITAELDSEPKYPNLHTATLDNWLKLSARNVYRIREGVDTIKDNVKPTPNIGERFIQGYMNYAERVITEAIKQLQHYEHRFNVTYEWGPR